ncbi:MAG: GntR family transcriptional regulator [Gammaproteobacteria bacterium]|nr:GntR family transcriptional regulator [Gammaproteobacteria bacterium]
MQNDIELTRLLNISRTTVRACVDHLIEMDIIKRDGPSKVVLRQPTEDDYFEISDQESTKEIVIEKYFLDLINTGKLLPGDKFSELELAQNSGCTTNTVREFLIKFSNYGLINKTPRARWEMVTFDEQFARELISFRQMVEMNSMSELLKLSDSDPIWKEFEDLLDKHIAVQKDIENSYLEFPDLDRALHLLIQDASKNRFARQFFEIASFICHYHYQWDKQGEFERIREAVDQHIDILNNLVTRNVSGSIMSLEKHLKTARQTLMRSVHGLEE